MGGEPPEDSPEVKPIRVDVLDPTQFSSVDQAPKLENGRVIPEPVAHHQDTARVRSELDEILAFSRIQAERLLDEHILAGQKRLADQPAVRSAGVAIATPLTSPAARTS